MIKTTKENLILSDQFASVYRNDVLFNNSTPGTFWKYQPATESGVCIIPVTDNDEILFVDEFRYAVNTFVTSLPRGGISENEPLVETAQRELEEELNYTSNNIEPFRSNITQNPSLITGHHDIYIAKNCVPLETPQEHEDTEIFGDLHIVPIADVYDFLSSRPLKDIISEHAVFAYLLERSYAKPSRSS